MQARSTDMLQEDARFLSKMKEFELEVGSHAAGELAVLDFTARESLSKPFTVDLTLVAREGIEVDTSTLLHQEAVLIVHLDAQTDRYFHGVLVRIEHWDTGAGKDRHRYKATIAPRLWTLSQRRRCRIFQEMSAPDIVRQVLKEGSVEIRAAMSASYPRRDYCVQYREGDFEFVSRLLEEEGIFYYFEHTHDGHTMVLTDAASSSPDLQGEKRIVYREKSGMATEEHVDSLFYRREVRPTNVVLRDRDYLRPGVDLTASASSDSGSSFEVYEYPARYEDPRTGSARSRTRLEELRVGSELARGTSTSRRLAPGYMFELDEHPVDGFNGEHLLLSVVHRGSQPEALSHGYRDPTETGPRRYENDFVCLRKGVPFRPERKTPQAIIPGPQTAVVVGPPNEEIFTDEHGRVKVQFHWDREGKNDDRSSCWIRVSQSWAGPGWGALYLPRIGHEVVVQFLEGDPDRPLVSGSVYNGQNPPPISLPADKTKSTLRSASSPGGEGSNELRFEDAAGSEEVYLHAEKDLSISVENDKTQHVGGNETLDVDKNRARSVGGNQTLLVEKDDSSTIGQDQSLEVLQNRSTVVGGNHAETIGNDQSVSVGATSSLKVVLAASESIGLGKMLNIGAAYAVTVGAAMNELVGGAKAEEVGGAKVEVIGGNKSERVIGARSLDVGEDLTEKVSGSRMLKVWKDLILNVTGTLQHIVKKDYKLDAKKISLSAEDQFSLQVGGATIEATKGGELVITGVKVAVTAAGNLTLKGSAISEN